MKTEGSKYSYIKWKSPEEMHYTSKKWLSELKFVSVEQLFLNNLVRSHTLQITALGIFEESRKLILAISNSELKGNLLLKKVQAHENQLSIMLDDIDQPKMEKAYTLTHGDMLLAMNDYLSDYRKLKGSLFDMIARVMRHEKQKRLLN